MHFGSVALLTCTLLVGTSWGTKGGQPPKPPCRPGFSESFYTVFVSRELQRGHSILKGKHCGYGGAGSHLLTDISISPPEINPNQRVT
ncbi:hypothetical protein DPEC_G00211070 [Dallia pectoralis]|uniref:Uncharacterized protein n=1 Tax=Dallia pectoralis TaxID=75939 RepID=A0ACC2G607_DALPE|nr:hypothetical protein DPEC_G00211070 [Dallia pectoralis]